MSDFTNYDGRLEAMANYCKAMYLNLAKVENVYHDTEELACSKSLPASYMDLLGIKKIGGKTIVWNQLAGNNDFSEDDLSGDGWEYGAGPNTAVSLSISDGELNLTTIGSLTANWNGANYHMDYLDNTANHKIFVSAILKNSEHSNAIIGCTNSTASASQIENLSDGYFKYSRTFTLDATTGSWRHVIQVQMNNYTSITVGEIVKCKHLLIYDLTSMFGAGNEPSTVAEVRAIFPGLYNGFDTGSLLSAGVTEIISKSADNATLETFSIPEEITTMEGYGWSCPGAYNYIDFENKKFVQNVGAVDLSDLTFGYGPTVGWSATLPNVKDPADDDTVFNGISDNYTAVSRNTQATAFSGGTDAGMISVSGGKVYVGTGDISIVPSGTLYYELAEPVETDISEYLTDTDIEVEAGGSLTFPNQLGDDYKIPVPVELEYIGV